MSTTVILDTDFLSAFLKIKRMPLIREFYRVETAYIPPAVEGEVALGQQLPRLLAIPWIEVVSPSSSQVQELLENSAFKSLGAGEREAIALAIELERSVLLTNDSRAGRIAATLDVTVANIPAFLLACKMAGLLNREAIENIIVDLQQKDYLRFRQNVLDLLLS